MTGNKQDDSEKKEAQNTVMIISIINNKGGVGKTTTAVNTSVALSILGKRVLVVDMDSQCNATDILINSRQHHIKNSLCDILNPEFGVVLAEAIYSTQWLGLDILPNIPESAILGPKMIINGVDSLFTLRKCLRSYAAANYDLTIIDCPPNLEAFVISALIASDCVIIPTMAGSKFSVNGLIKAKAFIDDIKASHNPDIRFLKLLVTMADKRTSICNNIIQAIRQSFDNSEVFNQVIPVNTDFQKAETLGQSIFDYNSSAPGAKAYMDVAREIINVLDLTNEG
jgi:chromosome partitioning protein